MSRPRHLIRFADGTFAPVEVPEGQGVLSEQLTVRNSPVLFGCRTGVCGTCVVEVIQGREALEPPDEDEQEILELYAEGQPSARLACQLEVKGDLTLLTHCKNRWSGS